MNSQTPIIVALDIGTTKICVLAAQQDQHGKLDIIGYGKVESVGVLRGVVSNIEKTVNGISQAIQEAEKVANIDIGVVCVGIAGQHIKSLQHRGMLTRQSGGDEISKQDIQQLIDDMHKLALPPGDKIIHVIPQEYIVDNEQGIVDPVGMSGRRLEANFHIITGQITATKNIYKCVEKAGLELATLTLEPIASAAAVLSEEEMEAGVALVDIGGGTTDIAIFHEGIIRHSAVIPFGGNVVTKDIKDGFGILQPQAEKLKLRFGSALSTEIEDDRIITIPGLKGQNPKEISESNLALIIQARMEEILDQIYWEIRRSGYEKRLVGGIVLTGGGALLANLSKLTELRTGLTARIGTPTEQLAHGYESELASPIYATAVGLLVKGFEELEEEQPRHHLPYSQPNPRTQPTKIEKTEPIATTNTQAEEDNTGQKQSIFSRVFSRMREWFEADPEKEKDKDKDKDKD